MCLNIANNLSLHPFSESVQQITELILIHWAPASSNGQGNWQLMMIWAGDTTTYRFHLLLSQIMAEKTTQAQIGK